jgi:hypothetical protein
MKFCKNCKRDISLYGALNRYKTKKGIVEKRYAVKGLCGMCVKRELNNNSFKWVRDDKTKSPLYSKWSGMKKRCYRKSCKDYKNYGAKGVIICEEWLNKENGFFNFEKWCLDNGYKDTLTIDRINPKGNYEPKNCRFVTRAEQNRNQRPKSNIGLDYIFDITGYIPKPTSNYRIFIGNRKSRYTKTLDNALKIRKEVYGY